ncbi:DUF2982 domain-containing protein [Paraglaciecola sp.]|uniref:DUF2982 domain-containing protein n=1 Tax=Paraglaciecola sp. TaxID=1920173 RepID=UPI0027401B1A|nr:DUF2982 domain-containing protein [Paraglaciecola sp.]MDP5030074.1 DUF2982 domain-containing protein [Paraglaciecola sp.]
MQELIEIRRAAKRNVFTTTIIGVFGLLVASQLLIWLPKSAYLIGILLTSFSIVTLLVAFFKFREPLHSFVLSRKTLYFQHKSGRWQLDWNNVQRMGVPRVAKGLDYQELSMVGIKLKSYQPFLAHISPRLITHILMEQRPLLLYGQDREQCNTGNCYGADLLEDDYFKDAEGNTYKGIQAMLANRMQKLRMRLGFDIFIAAGELDRSEHEFVKLLKQCQQHVLVDQTSHI